MKRIAAMLLALLLLLLPALAEEETEAQKAGLVAKGYVYITAGMEAQWYPLPDEESYDVTIRMLDPDGGEHENVVCITPDGAYMKSSTCDNQDCVGQGEVTLANKELRILGNWIICLPHQVTVELYSADEVLALLLAE